MDFDSQGHEDALSESLGGDELDDKLLEQICDEVVSRVRRGERPVLQEYVERHPKLERELHAIFPTLVLIEGRGREAAGGSALTQLERTRQLGEFRLIRELGRGGMGVVYEAEQRSLGRRVALKVLAQSPGAAGANALARFNTEARAAAKLHHANIVAVHDVGEADGFHFYTMQLVDGQGLDRVIEEMRHLRDEAERGHGSPVDVASKIGRESGFGDSSTREQRGAYFRSIARIGAQAARALEYAHERGILHRDVKPSNLLFDQDHKVWVTDFGLARDASAEGLTAPGDAVGTLRYMGPERFSARASARSDIYSLGVTLYELLALRPPFAAPDRASLVNAVLHSSAVPLRRLDPSIPLDLETIVAKAMDRDERRRYERAELLADDLERFVDSRPILARPTTRTRRAWLAAKRNPIAALLAVATVVLLVAVTALAIRSAVVSRQTAFETLVTAARESSVPAGPGQRRRSLEAIERATTISQSQELRDLAVAVLSRPAFELEKSWSIPDDDARPLATHPKSRVMAYIRHRRSDSNSLRDGDEVGPSREIVVSGSEGAVLASFALTERDSYRCEFSPDGEWLAIDGLNRRIAAVVRWRSDSTLRRIHDLKRSRLFSRDSRFLIGSLPDDSLAIFDLDQSELRVDLLPADSAYHSVAASPGGEFLAFSRREERAVDVFRYSSADAQVVLERVHSRPLSHRKSQLVWNSSGDDLLAFVDTELHRVSLDNDEDPVRLADPGSPVMRVSAGGGIAAADSWDGFVRVWDFSSTETIARIPGELESVISDGPTLAVRRRGGIDFYTFRGSGAFRGYRSRNDAVLSRGATADPEGRWLVIQGGTALELWDRTRSRHVGDVVAGHVLSLAFDAKTSSLITCGELGIIQWPWRESIDASEGAAKTQRTLRIGPPKILLRANVESLVDLSSRTVVIHGDERFHIVPIDRPESTRAVPVASSEWVENPVLSPDHRWIAGGEYANSNMRIWNATTGEPVIEVPVHLPRSQVRFSPDGQHLAVVSAELAVYEVGSWRRVGAAPRDRGVHTPGRVVFSADGRSVAYSFSNLDIRLLEFPSLELRMRVSPPSRHETFFDDALSLSQGLLAVPSKSPSMTRVWDISRLRAELSDLHLDWSGPPTSTPAEREPEESFRLVVRLGVLDPRIKRARELTLTRKFGEALDALRPLAPEFADVADFHYWSAQAHYGLGDEGAALGSIEKARSLRPEWIAPLLSLSIVLRDHGRQREAVDAARLALQRVERGLYDAGCRIALAWILVSPMDPDDATPAVANEALELLSKAAEALDEPERHRGLRRARALALLRARKREPLLEAHRDALSDLENSEATKKLSAMEAAVLAVASATTDEPSRAASRVPALLKIAETGVVASEERPVIRTLAEEARALLDRTRRE